MSTVSEGVGMKEMNSTSTFLKQLAIILAQAIKNGKKKGYEDEHQKGAKAILKHIKNGGKTSYQLVDTEDAALFEKILQSKRVPYVKLSDINGKTTYVTRDTDDKLVEQAWDMFAAEIKVGFKEMSPHDFINEHANQNVCTSVGYTEAELEIFRKEAAKVGFTYAVVGNENSKGLHDILYSERDKEAAAKALKGMEYEFSGPDGVTYKRAVEESLAIKNGILKTSRENKNETIYLVNSKNPMQFITLEKGIMVEHTLSITEKKDRNGQTEKVVKDKTRRTNPFGNRELTAAMKAYGECVMVPKENMDFIKGYDSAGNAIITDVNELGRALSKIDKDATGKAYPAYTSFITRSGSTSFEKMYTLSDLSPADMLKLTDALKKEGIEAFTVGNDLAYKEKDCAAVEKILSETIYKGLSFKERFHSMIYYEGRGPEGFNLDNLQEPVYIMAAQNPEFILKLDNTGYALLKNGEPIMSLGKDDPKFEEQLETMLDSMEDIAILTEKEMKKTPEERVQIIEDRASVKENEATKQYYKNYEEKKDQFLNSSFDDLSPEDQELIKRYAAHETKVTYVDRTFAEKILDADFGTKMKETTVDTTKTAKTTKDVEPER